MSVIHLLLNLAALLLWLTAIGPKVEPAIGRPLTLAAQIRPTQVRSQRRWTSLLALGVLLVIRAIFYRHLGPSVDWIATWSPGPVTVAFRSDVFTRMLLFSFVGFGWALYVFYSSLLLICVVNSSPESDDAITRLIRQHLGPIGRWPRILQALLPITVLAALWWPISRGFASIGLLPQPGPAKTVFWQSLVVGLGGCLSCRWVLSGLLIAGFFSSYLFLGRHAIWEFFDHSYRQIRRTLRWLPLHVGRIDLTGPLLLTLIWCTTWVLWEGIPRSITSHYPKLSGWEVPRLRKWYCDAEATTAADPPIRIPLPGHR